MQKPPICARHLFVEYQCKMGRAERTLKKPIMKGKTVMEKKSIQEIASVVFKALTLASRIFRYGAELEQRDWARLPVGEQ